MLLALLLGSCYRVLASVITIVGNAPSIATSFLVVVLVGMLLIVLATDTTSPSSWFVATRKQKCTNET